MTDPFDRLLIDPTPDVLWAALQEAVQAAHAAADPARQPGPPSRRLDDVLRALETTREGMVELGGNATAGRTADPNAIRVIWWSDPLRRKHIRLLGTSNEWTWLAVLYQEGIIDDRPLSHLEYVYPGRLARAQRDDRTPFLLAACDCGAVGPPAGLGWMGERCGPCHDRHAEGQAPPTPLSFRFEDAACWALAFSPDGQTLAVLADGLWVCDLRTGDRRRLLPWGCGSYERHELAFAEFGSRLVLVRQSDQPVIALVDVATGITLRRGLDAPNYGPCKLSPDGARIAVASEGRVQVQATRDGATQWSGEVRAASGLAFSPDGRRLAVADHYRPLGVWDLASGRRTLRFEDAVHPSSLSFSPDGQFLAGVSHLTDHPPRVIDLAPGGATELPAVPHRRLSHCRFAPTGRVLLALGGAILTVWDFDAGRGRLAVQWGRSPIQCAAWSPDGRWLAIGDSSGGVRLWSYPSLREV